MIKDNFSKQRRRALASWLGCVAVVFCCGAAGGALGQAYPARPIRLLLPYGPGGNSDIAARVLAQKLSESMRQQVIIDNRPGAGGIVATELARNAEPDGYTLLWLNAGHAVSVSLYKSLPYDPVRDFAPVSAVGFAGLALLVNANSPLRSVTALVAFAKANPGKFNIGVTFVGSTNHVSAELFKAMAGLEASEKQDRVGAAISQENTEQSAKAFVASVDAVISMLEKHPERLKDLEQVRGIQRKGIEDAMKRMNDLYAATMDRGGDKEDSSYGASLESSEGGSSSKG